MIRGPRRRATILLLAALVALYAATVLPSLGDDPIAGGDEGWIISASAPLARDGVFGSQLFAGFYGAEDHYYFNLPLHHVMLAGVFRIAGVGLEQARLVSFLFGLAALLLTWALARRIAGPAVAGLACGLLVLLRLNLAPFSGLTLTDLGATVRYDLIAVPFGLAALLLLLRAAPQPAPLPVASAGFLLGLAALTQFIGAFYALPAALFLLTLALPLSRRLLLCGLMGATMLLPFLPYGGYLAADWQDFRGQARSVEQRTDFLSPGFYLDQLADERHRYAIGTALQSLPDSPSELAQRPSARLVFLVLGPLAAALTLWRGRDDRSRRLLGLTLVCLALELALFESTKRLVYAVVLVPALCIALADGAAWLWTLRPSGLPPLLPRLAVMAALGLFAVEGLAVAAGDLRDARDAPSYAALGRDLRQRLPEGSVVLGDNRLWPALSGRELRSLLLLFYHTNPGISRDRTTDIFGALDRIAPDYVLLSPLSREILSRLSPRDASDLQRYLDTRTAAEGALGEPPYGPMEVYRVLR